MRTKTKKMRKKAMTAIPFWLSRPERSLRLLILREENIEPTEVCGLYF